MRTTHTAPSESFEFLGKPLDPESPEKFRQKYVEIGRSLAENEVLPGVLASGDVYAVFGVGDFYRRMRTGEAAQIDASPLELVVFVSNNGAGRLEKVANALEPFKSNHKDTIVMVTDAETGASESNNVEQAADQELPPFKISLSIVPLELLQNLLDQASEEDLKDPGSHKVAELVSKYKLDFLVEQGTSQTLWPKSIEDEAESGFLLYEDRHPINQIRHKLYKSIDKDREVADTQRINGLG